MYEVIRLLTGQARWVTSHVNQHVSISDLASGEPIIVSLTTLFVVESARCCSDECGMP